MFSGSQATKLYEDLINYQLQLSVRAKSEMDEKQAKKIEKELAMINSTCKSFLKLINYYKKQEQSDSESTATSTVTSGKRGGIKKVNANLYG